MTHMRKNLGQTQVKIEYLAGGLGIEEHVDGIALLAHDDGGMQLAIYWADDAGDRHTVLLEAADQKLATALAAVLSQGAAAASSRRDFSAFITFVRRAEVAH